MSARSVAPPLLSIGAMRQLAPVLLALVLAQANNLPSGVTPPAPVTVPSLGTTTTTPAPPSVPSLGSPGAPPAPATVPSYGTLTEGSQPLVVPSQR